MSSVSSKGTPSTDLPVPGQPFVFSVGRGGAREVRLGRRAHYHSSYDDNDSVFFSVSMISDYGSAWVLCGSVDGVYSYRRENRRLQHGPQLEPFRFRVPCEVWSKPSSLPRFMRRNVWALWFVHGNNSCCHESWQLQHGWQLEPSRLRVL